MTDHAVSTSPIRSLVLNAAYAQFQQEYFEGKRNKFDIPLAKKGRFFKRRFGRSCSQFLWKTKSYSEVAVQIKS